MYLLIPFLQKAMKYEVSFNQYNLQVEDEPGHWTIGMCFEGEQACLNESYDRNNVTEIAGIQLGTMRPGSLEFALLESLTYPSVETMNCEELCNCLSCGHGQCSDDIAQDKCLGNTPGFICRCSNSEAFPHYNSIIRDMVRTDSVCRQCENL